MKIDIKNIINGAVSGLLVLFFVWIAKIFWSVLINKVDFELAFKQGINFIKDNPDIVSLLIALFAVVGASMFNKFVKRNLDDRKSKFNTSLYRLMEKIGIKRIDRIVTISDDILLREVVIEKMIESWPRVAYDEKDFLNNQFIPSKENLILVVGRKINLIDCIEKLKEKENKILGVVCIGFKIAEEEKKQLGAGSISWEECLNIGFS